MNPPPSQPFFSIIIPTRNEALDILKTLDSIRQNTFHDYEVLVVDASNDQTPELVTGYQDSRFKLLKQNNRDGRCGARNQGIRAAQSEVVVILNADVRLPDDFLARLKIHYDEGADYVIVQSSVENQEHPFGAFLEAEHHYFYSENREKVNWCEGYSCRKHCAIEAGLFPEKLPVAICAGEDAVFGEEISKRFKRVEDYHLKVTHSVPEDFKIFWQQRTGRGQGCCQRYILLDGWSVFKTLIDSIRWSLKSILWIGLLFPMISYCRRLNHSFPQAKTSKLVWPVMISRLAHEIGRWKGFFQVLSRHRT